MYYRKNNPHGGAGGRTAAGTAVLLDFSASVNPLGMPAGVRAAAMRALEVAERYPDPCCRALVKGIAAAEGVPEEWVLAGAGASELIWAWCAALRPETAAAPVPCFSEYAAALTPHGGRFLPLPLSQEREFLPGPELLEALEQLRPAAVFLCNPNNPTGRRFPPTLAAEILSWCRRRGAQLLMDECFLPLSEDGVGLRDQLAAYPELFLLRAFTKSHGMAGLRLGYGLSAGIGLLRRMAELTPPWTVSGPAQAAGLAALEEADFLVESRALIRQERNRLSEGLRGLGLEVCPSEANFLLFRGPASLGEALELRGIVLRDCRNFPSLGPGWYRAAVRTGAENLALLRTMGEVLVARADGSLF